MTVLRLSSLLGLCAFVLGSVPIASAQTVYRCGADGRSYSQTPCPGGRTVDVDDSRTPEQQQQAQTAADRDARLGAALERERRTEEAIAAQRPTGPAALSPSRDSNGGAVNRSLNGVPHYSNSNKGATRRRSDRLEAPAVFIQTDAPPKTSSRTTVERATATATDPAKPTVKPQAKPPAKPAKSTDD
ncbi:MAG: hypothetical protein JWQ11_1808 [Rhizobacter sp.]|nr:hypothetical protein [Rhizobacter sp.]